MLPFLACCAFVGTILFFWMLILMDRGAIEERRRIHDRGIADRRAIADAYIARVSAPRSPQCDNCGAFHDPPRDDDCFLVNRLGAKSIRVGAKLERVVH